jgi:hypothetical protein
LILARNLTGAAVLAAPERTSPGVYAEPWRVVPASKPSEGPRVEVRLEKQRAEGTEGLGEGGEVREERAVCETEESAICVGEERGICPIWTALFAEDVPGYTREISSSDDSSDESDGG